MSEQIEVVDLGPVTERTRGVESMVLLENGTPPFNWQFMTPFPRGPKLEDPAQVPAGS